MSRERSAPPARDLKSTERIRPQSGHGPMIGQKAMRFGPSAKRMLVQMRPDRAKVGAVLTLAVVSVALSAVGPKILGRATDLIFAGVFGRQLPSDITKAQAVEAARASGDARVADMIAAMDSLVPGQGIDFSAVGVVLLIVLAVYTGSSLLGWLQGYLLNDVVQGTVYRLRAEVEAKIHRLPLDYFDRQPRGELLSRVTNDIDNIAQSLQQTMSQLLTSLLTVVGVVVMMFYISPTLALIALITIPVSLVIASLIMRRSQALFVSQWRCTGALSARVEEAFTGHELIKVFGRVGDVEAAFDKENAELFEVGFGAQFLSGLILPAIMFIGNLNYLVIAVVGGLRVASGTMSLGDVQAFISYSQQFTHPLSQVAAMINLLQSGVASAERAFELLDAEEETAEPAEPLIAQRSVARRGRVEFEGVSFRYDPETPLITDLSLLADPGHTVAIVGPTGAGKTTLVNLVMRFYDVDAGRITLDGVDIKTMRRADLRSQIGMVLQDTWLFEGTIRDNIAYGRPDASEAEIPRGLESDVRGPLRAPPARTVRHSRRRGRRQPQFRRAPADHDRPGVPRKPRAAHPGRGDQLGRYAHGAAVAARHGGPAHRPDQLRDRAPALDDPRRRSHPGDGGRSHRGAGHARHAAPAGPTPRCTTHSSPPLRSPDAASPYGAYVLVVLNRAVLRHQHRSVMASGRDNDLIGGISVERSGQATAFDQDRAGQLCEAQPVANRRKIEPFVERAVQDQLALLDLLGQLPDRDKREPQGAAPLTSRDRLRGTL